MMTKKLLLLMSLSSYFIMWLKFLKNWYFQKFKVSFKHKSVNLMSNGKIITLPLLPLMKWFRVVLFSNFKVQIFLNSWLDFCHSLNEKKERSDLLLPLCLRIPSNVFQRLLYKIRSWFNYSFNKLKGLWTTINKLEFTLLKLGPFCF
jgi:hypothetical protein